MISQQSARRQLLLFLGLSLLCLSPFLLNFVLLKCAYELSSYDEIARVQIRDNALHGSALTKNYISYKLALIRQIRPDIIALGSSRTLQFRAPYFSRRFVNAGLAMRNLEEGGIFLEKMLAEHRPKLILLGLDFWWFNARWAADENYADQTRNGTELTARGLLKPFALMGEGKLSWKDYFNIIFRHQLTNEVTRYPKNLGLRAILTSDGIRRDGSRLPALRIYPMPAAFSNDQPVGFDNTLEDIQKGTGRFIDGQTVGEERMRQLHRILQLCQDHHVPVIVFIPPVAPTVHRAMTAKEKNYAFFPEMRRLVRALPVETYDFSDPAAIGTTDCEYIDGYHGGDTNHMRILLEIARRNPDSQLMPYLNRPLLESASRKFAGRALAVLDPGMYRLKETDYLRMGCRK